MPAAAGVLVRDATHADGAACAAIYAPYVHDTAITFELEPPSADEMARRIASALGHEALFVDSPAPVGPRVHLIVHSERIRALVGYTADQPVSEAIAALVGWWQASQTRGLPHDS